jgi:hypothetical protein
MFDSKDQGEIWENSWPICEMLRTSIEGIKYARVFSQELYPCNKSSLSAKGDGEKANRYERRARVGSDGEMPRR